MSFTSTDFFVATGGCAGSNAPASPVCRCRNHPSRVCGGYAVVSPLQLGPDLQTRRIGLFTAGQINGTSATKSGRARDHRRHQRAALYARACGIATHVRQPTNRSHYVATKPTSAASRRPCYAGVDEYYQMFVPPAPVRQAPARAADERLTKTGIPHRRKSRVPLPACRKTCAARRGL